MWPSLIHINPQAFYAKCLDKLRNNPHLFGEGGPVANC
jgi:hypothetical protein